MNINPCRPPGSVLSPGVFYDPLTDEVPPLKLESTFLVWSSSRKREFDPSEQFLKNDRLFNKVDATGGHYMLWFDIGAS
jgi:hypothetical protein